MGIERLPEGNTLIADGGDGGELHARALEVDSLGRLVWAYIKCDVPFLHTARRLANGNTLMSASNGNKVDRGEPATATRSGRWRPGS